MTRLLYIGKVPRQTDESKIRVITTAAEADTALEGEVLRRWDFVSQVNSDTVRPSEIYPMRKLGDPLSDDAVDALELRPGQDGFAAVKEALEKPDGEVDQRIQRFWESVNREPPQGVHAYRNLGEKGGVLTEAVPTLGNASRYGTEPCLSDGQAVFWRYSGQIFAALMHFSLAGGFSSPNLGAVMNETGYLTSASKDATYRRLLETTLMVLDVMSDMRVGEGRGWKSAIRVRLLHSQVRRRIAARKGRLRMYDEAVSGLPINQADLAAVLGAFMIAPLWSMRRCSINLTHHELASYQAAWRHIGFYLGCDCDLLERFYGGSFEKAESAFAALAFENFPTEPPPDGFITPTYKILAAVSERPPRNSKIGFHLEYSRALLGNRLADDLALPRGTTREQLSVQSDIWTSWFMVSFGRLWRSGWELERQTLVSEIVEILVIWQLGERRTVFAWRDELLHAKKFTEDEGEGPGIKFGRDVGLAIKRRWIFLVSEMVAVSGAAVVGTLLATVGTAMWYRS